MTEVQIANVHSAALGGSRMGAPRHFLRPQHHLAMAWRRHQAMGMPSNWECPVTGNTMTLNGLQIAYSFAGQGKCLQRFRLLRNKRGGQISTGALTILTDIAYTTVKGVRNITRIFGCGVQKVHDAALSVAQSLMLLQICQPN